MSQKTPVAYHATNSDDTIKLGNLLANYFSPGDLVFVEGDLGAGKSTLIRSVIRRLLDQPKLEVPSPTFLIVLPYQNQKWQILHADLYRIEHPNELDELGLEDDPNNLVFVEWPQKAQRRLPVPELTISIEFHSSGTGRLIKFSAPNGSKSFARLSRDALFQ